MVRFIAMAAVAACVVAGAQWASACETVSENLDVRSLRSGSTMRCHSPRQTDLQFRLKYRLVPLRSTSPVQETEQERVAKKLAASIAQQSIISGVLWDDRQLLDEISRIA